MSVPEEIRQVERPRNTVVIDTKSHGLLRYAVRERAGAVCKTGHNPQPRNGRTVGHIINGVYVPVGQKRLAKNEPEWLSYGSSALVEAQSRDIIRDLLSVFHPCDAYKIMVIALLKIVHPGVTNSRISQQYNRTFIRVFYPNVSLSENTISTFLQNLGQSVDKRKEFYLARINSVCKSHHIVIDGTLKQDTSKVNTLSSFSRKSKIHGCLNISIIYAYDIESMEPICAKVYAGNIIDAKAYRNFVTSNNITKGIIVADKGFPPKNLEDIFTNNKELHYLSPLKRNDTRIIKNNMLLFEGMLHGIQKRVLYKKVKISNCKFLYSFKDNSRAQKEEKAYLDKIYKDNDYDKQKYIDKAKQFGTIVFLSDLDLDPETVWHCYDDRWMIELVFDYYKNDLSLDTTRVQNESSVWGEEFINFISTLITCRIIRLSEKTKILDQLSFGEMMDDLEHVMRPVKEYCRNEIPSIDDNKWMNATNATMDILVTLGLAKPILVSSPEPKKRGRPRLEHRDLVGPKRPRGRPRKTQVAPSTSL